MTRPTRLRRLLATLAVLAFGLGAAACAEVETEGGGGTTGGGADAELEGDFDSGDLGGDLYDDGGDGTEAEE